MKKTQQLVDRSERATLWRRVVRQLERRPFPSGGIADLILLMLAQLSRSFWAA
jgi:uncharacterized membrane protein YdfJ with MMPL/SSD domain